MRAFAVTVLLASAPASATILDVHLTGTVSDATANTGFAVGDAVTGRFTFDTVTGHVLSDVLGGYRAPARYDLSGITPDLSEAEFKTGTPFFPAPLQYVRFYTVLTSSVTQQGGFYPTFLNGSTLASVLESQLGNLDLSGDFFASTAGYSSQDQSGGNFTRFDVNLTGVTAAVPEPAPLVALALGTVLIAAARRRPA